jgi:hypothetical protein
MESGGGAGAMCPLPPCTAENCLELFAASVGFNFTALLRSVAFARVDPGRSLRIDLQEAESDSALEKEIEE